MSHGALTRDSHQTIAAAFSDLDGLSNSGEGGEARYRNDAPERPWGPFWERILAELLRSSPDAAPATTYLRRSQGHIGDRWEELGAALDNIARTRAVEHRIVSAAVDGLRTAKAVVAQYAPPDRAGA